jgi:hypothetical protein
MANILPGEYFQLTRSGAVPAEPGEPDYVVCRRLEDFRHGLPAGADTAPCTECGALVAFNPQGPWLDKPRVCMQCRQITPLEPT